MSHPRSPLKRLPRRRLPGDSLSAMMTGTPMLGLMLWGMLPFFFLGLILSEWSRYLRNSSPHPVMMTVVGVAATLVAIPLAYSRYRRLVCLARGREAERRVGMMLEDLRADGYKVFHDIDTGRGNIDHALIGPAGVFAIETKYAMCPRKGDPDIFYDGVSVRMRGRAPQRAPLRQAEAEAGALRRILAGAIAGDRLRVVPVLVYPGWFVHRTEAAGGARPRVRVTNPKLLFRLREMKAQYSPSEVAALAKAMEAYLDSPARAGVSQH